MCFSSPLRMKNKKKTKKTSFCHPGQSIGACAMTTKFSTMKFALSKKNVVAFPTKNSVLDKFPLCPQCAPPPLKNVFFCRLAVSESRKVVYVYVYVANPPAPYSIQKCPEPQICQRFVPTIVFRGSNQGDPNLSRICRNFEK